MVLIVIGYITGEGIGFVGHKGADQATVDSAISSCKKWGGKVVYDSNGDYSDCLTNGHSADSY